MDHEKLTRLWREAGSPVADIPIWVHPELGMAISQNTTEFYTGKLLIDCDGDEFLGHEGVLVPDWRNSLVEFCLMREAERVAGRPLSWVQVADLEEPEHWIVRVPARWGSWPVSDLHDSRIECALAVIKACREANDAT